MCVTARYRTISERWFTWAEPNFHGSAQLFIADNHIHITVQSEMLGVILTRKLHQSRINF